MATELVSASAISLLALLWCCLDTWYVAVLLSLGVVVWLWPRGNIEVVGTTASHWKRLVVGARLLKIKRRAFANLGPHLHDLKRSGVGARQSLRTMWSSLGRDLDVIKRRGRD